MTITTRIEHPNRGDITPAALPYAERWLIERMCAALMIAIPNASIRIEVGWDKGYEEETIVEGASPIEALQVKTLVALTFRATLIEWYKHVRDTKGRLDGTLMFEEIQHAAS